MNRGQTTGLLNLEKKSLLNLSLNFERHYKELCRTVLQTLKGYHYIGIYLNRIKVWGTDLAKAFLSKSS